MGHNKVVNKSLNLVFPAVEIFDECPGTNE